MTNGTRTLAALAAALAIPAAASAQTATAEQNNLAVHAFMSAVDLNEVQQSMLAQERATNAEVKTFANAMVSDHSESLHAREMRVAQLGTGLIEGQMNHGAAGGNAHAGHGAAAGTGSGTGTGTGTAAGSGQGHAGHAQGGPQTSAMPPLTPAQLAAFQQAVLAHPVSRVVATSGQQNLGVLQGVTGPQFDATYMDAQIGAHRYALSQMDRLIQQGGVSEEMLGVMQAMRASIAAHLEQAQVIRARLQ